jgi:glycogen operon protein
MANLCLLVRCSAEAPEYDRNGDVVFIVFNAEGRAAKARLPDSPAGKTWLRAIDTGRPDCDHDPCLAGSAQKIGEHSVVIFCLGDKPESDG